jgi:polyhydroxyalkanoate synthesis regulator phasin
VEDKMVELLEKIYTEFKDFKEETKNNFQRLESKLEVEVTQKLEALFDGYKTNSEKIDELDNKVDNLQFDVNNISIKVASNDNKIIEIRRDLRSVR